jgi:hypothetical protein
MATINSYFSDFIREIKLTDSQADGCKTGHSTLRKRLLNDADLAPIIIDTFLQGSYRRSTAVRPIDSDSNADVDVVVVTTLDKVKVKPQEALDKFKPFLEKYYTGKYKLQGRSWGIKLSYVDLDLVPTSAPSEAQKAVLKSASVITDRTLEESLDWALKPSWLPSEQRNPTLLKGYLAKLEVEKEWQAEPLWIPDREAKIWDETDPLAQIDATSKKNGSCNGHFVNVVKCLKWWRAAKEPKPKYPKSYPLEHLTWTCCPDDIKSVAEGVVKTLENIRDRYITEAILKKVPFLPDHGVPAHNVLERVSGDDWSAFHKIVTKASELAKKAYDEEDVRESAVLWKQLFGDKFPDPPAKSNTSGGFTPRKEASIIGGGRFA